MLRRILVVGLLVGASLSIPAQAAPLRCPDQGTRVERTNVGGLAWRGPSNAGPLICVDQSGASRFLGYWRTSDPFYASGGSELVREFMNAGDGPGRPVQIRYFSQNRNVDSVMVWESWQVLGRDRVDVVAGSFDTTKVERQYWVMGTNYRYTETVWFDRASGAPVKSEVEHRNAIMSPDVVSWQAVGMQPGRPGA